MSKTLWCEAGKHNFEHPGGRGRPPKNCPEHRQLPNAQDAIKHFETESHDIRPQAKLNPFIAKAQKQAKAKAAVERMNKGKEEAAEQRVKDEAEAIESEYSEIDGKIAKVDAEYTAQRQKAIKAQTTEDIAKEFNSLDVLLGRLVGLLQRKRYLEKRVDQMTDPNYESLEKVADRVVPVNDRGETFAEAQKRTRDDLTQIFQEVDDRETMIEMAEAEGDEPEEGYNDLLSNPEQYDDPYDDIADTFAQIYEEHGLS